MERAQCLQGPQNPPAQAHHTKHSQLGLGQMEAQKTKVRRRPEQRHVPGTPRTGRTALTRGRNKSHLQGRGIYFAPSSYKAVCQEIFPKGHRKVGKFQLYKSSPPFDPSGRHSWKRKDIPNFCDKLKCKVESRFCGQLKKRENMHMGAHEYILEGHTRSQ